jgi:hypothetical protein
MLARRDQLMTEIAELNAELVEAECEAAGLDAAWKNVWQPAGIDPLPPREMHPSWTAKFENLRARAETSRLLRRKVADLEQMLREHRTALTTELELSGETALPLGDLESVLRRSERSLIGWRSKSGGGFISCSR